MFVVFRSKHAPAPAERNAQRTFRPCGALGSWAGDDYKHCAPDGASLRRGQSGRGLIEWDSPSAVEKETARPLLCSVAHPIAMPARRQ